MTMKKVSLDSIEYEAAAEVVNALEKALLRADASDEALNTEKAAHEATQAKLDSATADLKKARELNIDDLVATRIKSRNDIETAARKVLGTEAKLDGLTDAQVREQAILKAYPEAKLDGKSEEYLQARFDSAIDSVVKTDDSAIGSQREKATTRKDTNIDACDAEGKAKKSMHDSMTSRWKGEEKK